LKGLLCMHLKLTCFLVSLFYLNLFATDFFTDKRSFWLTGSGGYHNSKIDYRSESHALNVYTTVRFFPCRYFFIGPDLGWNSSYNIYDYGSYQQEKGTINQWSAGLDFGFAFGKNGYVIPYILSNAKYIGTHSDFEPSGYFHHRFELVSFYLGIMIPLFDSIGLQIESSCKIASIGTFESGNRNIFGFSFGFCGIGKKSAISLLGNI
jgi:hypothetical protein